MKQVKTSSELQHYNKGFHTKKNSSSTAVVDNDQQNGKNKYAIVLVGDNSSISTEEPSVQPNPIGGLMTDVEKMQQAMDLLRQIADNPENICQNLETNNELGLISNYRQDVKRAGLEILDSMDKLKLYMESAKDIAVRLTAKRGPVRMEDPASCSLPQNETEKNNSGSVDTSKKTEDTTIEATKVIYIPIASYCTI